MSVLFLWGPLQFFGWGKSPKVLVRVSNVGSGKEYRKSKNMGSHIDMDVENVLVQAMYLFASFSSNYYSMIICCINFAIVRKIMKENGK